MSAAALALVLAAALMHAVWNIAAKRAGGDHRFALLSAAAVVVLWAPVAAWFGLRDAWHWSGLQWAAVLASAVIHLLYFTVLLAGYRAADLTVVYPVARGTAPLLAVAGAVLLLGERPGVAGAAGALAVCGGVFVLAGGPALWRGSHDPAQRLRVLAGLRWGAGAGALIASYTVLDAFAVKVLLVAPVLLDYFGNALRLPFLLPAALRDPAGLAAAARGQWRAALVVAVLGPLGYILVLTAVQMAPLAHVAPAREVSMLFAALLGGTLLGEGDRVLRGIGAAAVALGVGLLALG